jgi:D-galactarolactone cycloisomerase
VIDRADVLVLSHRLSRTRYYSTGSNTTRDSVLVRIRDREGTTGWGETYLVPGVVEGARAVAETLVGLDPSQAADRLTRLEHAHRWAVGAVSTALDDLRGRVAGVPSGTLHGPRLRERVTAYASSTGYVDGVPLAEAWLAEAELLHDAGYRQLKLRIGRGPISEELPAMEQVVAQAPDVTWMADGNGAYGFDDALELGIGLEALGMRWLEEPLPTSDYAAYRPLAHALRIPLAGGEILETTAQAAAALSAGAFDIVQPDLAICGGAGPLLEIATLTAGQRVACIPHACNGAILRAATLQVLSVLPVADGLPAWATPVLEDDVGENPLRTDLVRDAPAVEDGWIAVPAGPGLGIEVDEAAVERYAVAT